MRKPVLLLFALLLSAPALAGPDFRLTDVTTGDEHRLSDYRGKWVVVNYWATWCPPCLEEIPDLIHFHEKHKDGDAVVIGVNMEELAEGRLARFVDDNLITYPVGPRTSPEQMVGPVPGLPTTYLFSPDGRPVARQVGPIGSEELESFIAGYERQASR